MNSKTKALHKSVEKPHAFNMIKEGEHKGKMSYYNPSKKSFSVRTPSHKDLAKEKELKHFREHGIK